MYTRRILSASAALFILGCGPTTINVTTTGEGEGGEESSSGAPISGSTGLGGTDSGVDTSTTEGASSGGSSDPNSGGGSTSTGEPLPEPLCEWNATPPVWCSCDGVPSHPTECGCVLVDGACLCPGDPAVYPPELCSDDVCILDQATGECLCDGTPADASLCTCFPAMIGGRCMCDGDPIDPTLCGCALDGSGACGCDDGDHHPVSCGWPCAPSGPDPCVCGNFPAPDDWCA